MSENRMTGYGMKLELGGVDAGPPYTRIAGLTEIKPPKKEKGVVEVTEHRVPSDPDYGSMEFIGDPLTDFGEVAGKINFIAGDASQAALEATLGTTRHYRVSYPGDARVIELKGVLTKFEEPSLPATGKKAIEIDFSIKVTGKPIYT